jgi:uncharacterized protein YdeI (YjbR/CyaY-like superfamily)
MNNDTRMKSNDPILPFESPAAWDAWLKQHHTTAKGVWVKIAKKSSGIPTITYAEALDGALCYGWIDSQKASFDERFFLQRFSPRGPRSPWSQLNREKVETLIAAGRVQPAGLAQIDGAKADGRWDRAYAPQSRMPVPDDFQAALEKNRPAAKFFATLDAANRYAILYRLQTAKTPETRQARIDKCIAMLQHEKKFHP